MIPSTTSFLAVLQAVGHLAIMREAILQCCSRTLGIQAALLKDDSKNLLNACMLYISNGDVQTLKLLLQSAAHCSVAAPGAHDNG